MSVASGFALSRCHMSDLAQRMARLGMNFVFSRSCSRRIMCRLPRKKISTRISSSLAVSFLMSACRGLKPIVSICVLQRFRTAQPCRSGSSATHPSPFGALSHSGDDPLSAFQRLDIASTRCNMHLVEASPNPAKRLWAEEGSNLRLQPLPERRVCRMNGQGRASPCFSE